MKKVVLTLITLVIFTVVSHASGMQPDSLVKPTPRPSLLALTALKVGNMYLKIVYGQPLKKGRTIFGALEPYGKIWRTGANEATEITFTKDVRINNKILKAGTYTLFSIPQESKWTFIFNSELGQWGAYKYDESKDVLRAKSMAKSSPVFHEQLKLDIAKEKVSLYWGNLEVSL